MNFSDVLDEFILDNEFRNNSKKTISNYRSMIRYFLDFYNGTLEGLTINDIKSYNSYLRSIVKKDGNFLSDDTVCTYLRQLKVFLKYCEANGYIFSGIANFKMPRAQKLNIRILSNDELLSIFNVYQGVDFCSIRNRLIIALLIDLGLRRVEISRMRLEDDYKEDLYINGKGGKERTLKKSEYIKGLMLKYIKIRHVYDSKNSKAMFLTDEGNPISYYFVSRLIQDVRVKSGVTRVYAHLFRHTFATNYILNGGEALKLQILLGHESLEMVRKYVHLANQLKLDNSTSYIDNYLVKSSKI